MGIKNYVSNLIIKRLEGYIAIIENKKIQKENQKKKQIISKIKKIGNNSFFWGNEHFISGGENFTIGENVHINNNCYIRAEGGLEIGDNTHISRNLLLYTVNHDFKGNALPYDNGLIKKKVIIGKNVWIGMNVIISPGTVIGDGAIIGMGTVVSGIVPEKTIIGNQKWRIIGERDDLHYNNLEQSKKYGGIDGNLYFSTTNESILSKENRKINTKRSTLELFGENRHQYVIKTFDLVQNSKQSFENEKLAAEIFGKYKWFPKTDIKENSLQIEYFDHKDRLDICLDNLTNEEKESIKNQIIFILIDLYKNGYSHRDLHQKNIFFSNGIVKLIDYETINKIQPNVEFFDSYDITGKNDESPYRTMNMCILHNSDVSLNKLFQFSNVTDFKNYFDEVFENELRKISKTFFTRKSSADGRHTLGRSLIYNTFNLKNLIVTPEKGQRNIEKRLLKFGINKDLIENKRILDLGSNIGGILCGLSQYNFKEAIGIEYDLEKVEISRSIVAYNDLKNIHFYQSDLETDEFLSIAHGEFDVVFSLAVIEHLKNKADFLRRLYEKTTKILFLEGNANTDIDELTKSLLNVGFSEVNYLGLSDDEQFSDNNNRPIFKVMK